MTGRRMSSRACEALARGGVWLLPEEAITSHGPIGRQAQKGSLHRFDRLRTYIVCATPFASQPTLLRYLPEITWETEVWSANAPTHPVPFNGGRLLGQYTAEGKSRERAGLCNA
jgi:hypothetical protein